MTVQLSFQRFSFLPFPVKLQAWIMSAEINLASASFASLARIVDQNSLQRGAIFLTKFLGFLSALSFLPTQSNWTHLKSLALHHNIGGPMLDIVIFQVSGLLLQFQCCVELFGVHDLVFGHLPINLKMSSASSEAF